MQSNTAGGRPPIAIEIAGQRLRLTDHGNERHLQELAALVNQRVEGLQRAAKGAPPSTLLALTSLDLADEIVSLRRKLDEVRLEADRAVAEAERRARDAEKVARTAITETLAEIDRAIAADEAMHALGARGHLGS